MHGLVWYEIQILKEEKKSDASERLVSTKPSIYFLAFAPNVFDGFENLSGSMHSILFIIYGIKLIRGGVGQSSVMTIVVL